MSPAGLKGVAEEVGLELVVVCGDNWATLPAERSEPRPPRGAARKRWPTLATATYSASIESRRLATRRRRGRRSVRSLEEKYIRRSGIFAVSRREFRLSVQRVRVSNGRPRTGAAHDVDRESLGASGGQECRRLRADATGAGRPVAGLGRHRAVRDSRSTRLPGATRSPATGRHRQRPLRLYRKVQRRQADGDRPGVRAAPRNGEAVPRDTG